MKYYSTRSANINLEATEAILKGISEDGGLFVPESIPKLPIPIEEFVGKDYRDTAFLVMKQFFTDMTDEELRACVDAAYDAKFDTPEIAPIKEADGDDYLELFHGKTIAFKDMALSILPHLMTTSAKKHGLNNEIVILTATSGDTGKAALAGFADVPGTRIIVFYPKNGVSKIQELQMVTEAGKNTYVVGITGNFDDAQTGVKKMFTDKELGERLAKAGFQFSSANSINIGRLIPQVAYYVYGYAKMRQQGIIAAGEEINVVVPTGNFGNILAASYAKKMGLPVKKLICASNQNKVLFDFFTTGTYDKNRPFYLSASPSMDILISSNLERLIYAVAGSPEKTKELMEKLSKEGSYSISKEMQEGLGDFYAGYATEEDTFSRIRSLYESCSYVIDPHTAVASHVCKQYKTETGDKTKCLIASTASPYKFPKSVIKAIKAEDAEQDDFALTKLLSSLSGVKIPEAVANLENAKILHDTVCETEEMQRIVEEHLKK